LIVVCNYLYWCALLYAVRSEVDCLCGLVVRVPGYRSREIRVQFLALPDFLRSSGSGMGST
jgi:hypothetical protein